MSAAGCRPARAPSAILGLHVLPLPRTYSIASDWPPSQVDIGQSHPQPFAARSDRGGGRKRSQDAASASATKCCPHHHLSACVCFFLLLGPPPAVCTGPFSFAPPLAGGLAHNKFGSPLCGFFDPSPSRRQFFLHTTTTQTIHPQFISPPPFHADGTTPPLLYCSPSSHHNRALQAVFLLPLSPPPLPAGAGAIFQSHQAAVRSLAAHQRKRVVHIHAQPQSIDAGSAGRITPPFFVKPLQLRRRALKHTLSFAPPFCSARSSSAPRQPVRAARLSNCCPAVWSERSALLGMLRAHICGSKHTNRVTGNVGVLISFE